MKLDTVFCALNDGELAAAAGITPDAVRKWRERGRIPPQYWTRIARIARAAGHPNITAEAIEAACAG